MQTATNAGLRGVAGQGAQRVTQQLAHIVLHPQGSVPIAAPLACGTAYSKIRRRALRRDAGRGLGQRPRVSIVPLAAGPTSPIATSGLGLFPAGMQTARVQLPAVVLQIEASQVMSDEAFIDTVGQALQGGCNMVVLWDSSGGGAMYDAALRVQEALRGRAPLLVVDRTDVAQAIGAQGVLLTDQGMPTVVTKRMMSQALVGRVVDSEAAAVAAAADGASLVLIGGPGGAAPSAAVLSAAKTGQRSGNPIPVLLSVRAADAGGAAAVEAAMEADVDGVAVSVEALPTVARACFDLAETSSVTEFTQAILTRLNVKAATADAARAKRTASPKPSQKAVAEPSASNSASSSAASTSAPSASSKEAAPKAAKAADAAPPAVAPSRSSPATAPAPLVTRKPGSSSRPLRRLMDPERETLLTEEKAALAEMLMFLEETLPNTPEMSLLHEALKALDEPFLVAVVGEFNSGKSSVINALLGRRYLAEGILPTTNEISILKYAPDAPAGANPATAQLVQQKDGLYVRYLPAKLLQDMSIVDTPGTNVILERQQRLTEEYVPRADLVLFVMSADRPFSESEVRFLEYIRQWQKKVVFVVNKADILESMDEVAAVKEFVSDNAQRILRLDRPAVIAVSSRSALRAKLTASNLPITASFDSDTPSTAPATLPASSVDPEALESALSNSRDWSSSNFAELERQVSNFLVGKGEGSGEGIRLKLQTPLTIADALLGAAGRQLASDLTAARSELEGVQLVGVQLGRFRAEMDKDAAAQRAALQPVLAEVLSRAERFVDNTVQLSNAPLLLSIAAGNKEYPFRAAFEKEVVGNGFDSLKVAVGEHSSWLRANCDNQRDYYAAFAASRAAAAGVPGVTTPAASAPPRTESSTGDRAGSGADASTSSGSASPALRAVADFNVRAISTLLDTELQQAMATTAGTAVGAPVFGLFAMQVIQNTLEDLLVAGLAGAVSYVSLLNLPLRRADLKAKIGRVAGNFVNDVQARMEEEVQAEVKSVVAAVRELMAPIEDAYGGEVARLEERQADLEAFQRRLQELQRRTADLE